MPTTETRRLNPIVMWAIFLAIILLAFLILRSSTHDAVEVKVASVDRQNLISSISTNGKVEPIGEFQAYAPASGVIAKVYVEVLQRVRTGDLLLKMDDADAKAKMASANAVLRTAEATLHDMEQGGSQEEHITLSGDLNHAQLEQQQATRISRLSNSSNRKAPPPPARSPLRRKDCKRRTTPSRAFRLRSTQRYSPADKARVEAQVADASASLEAAERTYASYNIRTPQSGTVYSIPVSDYDFVPGGENLIAIADLNKIQVHAYFDEPEIGKLAVGQAVKIAWDAKPNQIWHGHITIAPTTVINYGTRNVGECIITVDDAHGDLLPNTNVIVTVTTAQRFNALSIPREALHTEAGNFVFRVINGKLLRTPVQVGVATNLIRAEITGGLTEKDMVALGSVNNRELSNGLAVKVVD